MRIVILQPVSKLGDVDGNQDRADQMLKKVNLEDIDLLSLPECAFTGCNFTSLTHAFPSMEHTVSGNTSIWARTVALKHGCVVTVGYPEKVDTSARWPASPEYYSSAIAVNANGETLFNYRKTFLCSTDKKWALEGEGGFFDGSIEGLGNTVMGFDTDFNENLEFAHHVVKRKANLVILAMSWPVSSSQWFNLLAPVIEAEPKDEIIFVLANRTGTENGMVYAGMSAVFGIHADKIKVYGLLGRDEGLLVVDTSVPVFTWSARQGIVVDQELPIPEWFPPSVQQRNVAVVSMTQESTELDEDTLNRLSQTLQPVDPDYLIVLPEPTSDLLGGLQQFVGPLEGGIKAIHTYAPNSTTVSDLEKSVFRRVYHAKHHTLYQKHRLDSEQTRVHNFSRGPGARAPTPNRQVQLAEQTSPTTPINDSAWYTKPANSPIILPVSQKAQNTREIQPQQSSSTQSGALRRRSTL